jgi:uncharacterized protein (TIGR02757 family)
VNSLLRERLEYLYRTYDHSYLNTDPIALVRRYDDPADREIAALVVSSIAFGQVRQIVRSAEYALSLMPPGPASFVRNFDPAMELKKWRRFYYRMVRPSDLLRLLHILQSILKRFSSIGEWVEDNYRPDDPHLGVAWGRCVAEMKRIDQLEWRWTRSRGHGFAHLLADPEKKSACKRAHLLLRWMVRRDGVDLGQWNLPPSKLLIPMDTHVQRIAYNIGLTDRRDASIRTSLDITSALAEIDPDDPVKYDFALCRLGILKLCPRKRDPVKCTSCSIYLICRL